jgi:hypothetical protein
MVATISGFGVCCVSQSKVTRSGLWPTIVCLPLWGQLGRRRRAQSLALPRNSRSLLMFGRLDGAGIEIASRRSGDLMSQ